MGCSMGRKGEIMIFLQKHEYVKKCYGCVSPSKERHELGDRENP